ncbi:hypothetical protein LOTGIDRAFT_152120 [Lottia gigantea]|uniref:G-protein coupled receptors family 1 profile domain-containing protein n=1 Tax=Lottia gigantea TaxID=225164 RepID=V4AM66_LOTGI|nr:hypothetical protein LOTGIDRAFT_152120 [Lottia gigantea]ESP05289.1 hypothetical protein LOTGIDRAFT_152120 [Lottia gigantea]
MSNISSSSVVYWALNNYGVTIFDIIVNIIVLTIASWIITLNVIVLKVLHDKNNKEPSEYFIINLSVADLLTGVYLVYNTLYNLVNFQNLVECLIRFGLGMGFSMVSIWQLVALSMDRYFKIIYPYRYADRCNKVSMIMVSVITWLLTMMIGLLPAFGWQHPQPSQYTCGFMKILTIGYFQLLLVVYLGPFFVLLIIYLRIFKEAHRHAVVINSTAPKAQTNNTNHSLKTVFIVVGTYILCWAPMGIVVILHVEDALEGYTLLEKGNLIVYATAFAYTNSLLNPIIYAIKIPRIRNRFRGIFCRPRRQSRAPSNSAPTDIITVTPID